ncbi:MAG TPA: peptidoglycan-binding protein [Candidatus Paceibacterota bacterium]|nr:peptidoglycan-binding protein [Candidatus Paceibacterota bacterium]
MSAKIRAAVALGAVLLFAPPAYASVSLSVGSLSPSTNISAGTNVSFTVNASGFSGPTYSLTDSFSGATDSSANINSSGNFSWTPTTAEIGTHNITVTVSDSSGNTATTVEQITVSQPVSLSIQSLSPSSSLGTGQTLTFSAVASGFSSPVYTISDSFSGSTISNADINSSGTFSWIPDSTQVGNHTITFYATDSYGHSANTNIVVAVTPGAAAAVTTTTGSGLAQNKIQSIVSLLQSFGADQSVVNQVAAELGGLQTSTAAPTDATVANSYTFTSYLSPGDSSDEVLALQNLLAKEGYLTATPNGYYGPATTAAVEAFQAAHGIEQLGVVGPSTRAALNSAESSPSSSANATFVSFLDVGSTGDEVTALQEKLAALGYFSAVATGYFGSATQAAVEAFQSAHGIDAVGYVGPATRAALNAQ